MQSASGAARRPRQATDAALAEARAELPGLIERATAAAIATRMLRQHGLEWPDLIARAAHTCPAVADDGAAPAATPPRYQGDVSRRAWWCLLYGADFTDAARRFLEDLRARPRPLTDKQLDWLEALEHRVRQAAEAVRR